jgi:hypothetical protein
MKAVRGMVKLRLEGLMPERALLRLRRAQIPVFQVEKAEKNQIVFCIYKKDCKKVFAIYPNVCYNECVYSAYTVQVLGVVGAQRYIEWAKRRVGMLLGGLLCILLVLFFDPFVCAVEFTASSVYKREAYIALEEEGITPFSFYEVGKEDVVCAKLLQIPNVEFCSVKRVGHRVLVEIRTGKTYTKQIDKNAMAAKHTGEITAITVLRGTPSKRVGDKVREGEILVQPYYETEQGGQVRVEIISRVRIMCTYEADIEAETAQEAFAKAYLQLGITPDGEIIKTEITENGSLYRVRIDYAVIETMNF